MRRAASLLAGAAIMLGAFAWWGLYTDQGQRRYDEMDGMIPLFAAIAAASCVAAAALLCALMLWRGGRSG